MDTEPTGPGLPDPGPSDPAPLDDLDREILAASATLTTGSAADAGKPFSGYSAILPRSSSPPCGPTCW